MSMLQTGRRALSLAGVLSLGTATAVTAFAQQPTPAQGQGQLEEIVVTGSRIARRDFQSQSPIVTVDKEAFTNRTNIGLEATLDQLPQFNMTGAGSQAYGAGSTPFPQANAAPGAATVNLRGLGLNRNLVLLDGRRAQPVNGYLVVDLNTIPAAAIDRVEVITGGAAAVYGADAIAGVVNFILKKNFEGVQINAQSGMSQEGDGNESTINGLLGASFADGRGSVMLGVDYSKRDRIFSRDRDWVVTGWNDPGTNHGGLGSSPLSQFTGSPSGPIPAGGYTGYPLTPGGAYWIDQNGKVFNNLRPLDTAHPYTGPVGPGTNYRINPDGSLGFVDPEHSYLQIPLERYSLFGSGHIALTDKVEVFAQMNFSETYTEAPGFQSGVFNVWSPTIPYIPAYDDPASPTFGQAPAGTKLHPVPADLANILNQRPGSAPGTTTSVPWTYAGGLDYLGNFTTNTTANVYQVVGGLRSDFEVNNNNWNWTVYASHGNTHVNAYQPEGFPYLPRVQNLFNANQYGAGFDINTLPGFTPVAVTGHCTSGLPIFNPDGSVNNTHSVSKDCSDYVVLRMNSVTTIEQNIFEGTVTGTIINMAGGPLQFAAGADYRKENFTFQPDSGYNANQDFPNVIQNVVLPVSVDGSTDVREVYGELAIPLFKNNRIEIDPGVRYSDYDTVGKTTTYKLLGTLKLTDRFRFRGGYQYANRAPNVVELFTPKGGSSIDFVAPDLCGSWAGVPTYGNVASNPNRLNVQILCHELMAREGAPASWYVPNQNGPSGANDYQYNVFGGYGPSAYFPLALAIQEGNPTLDNESSDTYTAGVVMSLANRLTLSLDWYQVKLDNAIAIPGHAAVYQQCLDSKFNPLIASAPGSHTGAELAAGNPFCALIQREWVGGAPLTPGNYGADRKFKAQYINSGGIDTEGYDIQVDWGIGNFNVNFQTSLLDSYSLSAFPGAAFVDYTGTVTNDSFDYRFLSTVRWGKGPLSVGARLQYLPSLKPAPGAATNALPVDSYDRLDVFGSWTFKQHWMLRGGVDNLLNVDPVWVGATTNNNAIGTTNANYDQIGRRVYLGVQVSL